MEFIMLGFFAAGLMACLFSGASIVYALLFGYLIFFAYGLHCGLSVKRLCRLSLDGIYGVRMVLVVFMLIGGITAVWRASGTIPFIVYEAGHFISPEAFLPVTFLLNAGLSMLIGTSFGTAATMGVITMTIGNSIGVNPAWSGGAILSGMYVGDRCSPLSTSALVVASITQTDLYENLVQMARRAAIPCLITCIFYGCMGCMLPHEQVNLDILDKFQAFYHLSWIVLIPALMVIVMSIAKIAVWKTMLVSLLAASAICMTCQSMDVKSLVMTIFNGCHAPDDSLAAMMNGGGVKSMISPALIVSISCSYSGIFEETNLLERIQREIYKMSSYLNPFGCTAVVSLGVASVACNQTLTSIMVEKLCGALFPNRRETALGLEDTAIVISALIPWSVASAVPLAALGAPVWTMLFAFYLYLQPLTSGILFRKRYGRKRNK